MINKIQNDVVIGSKVKLLLICTKIKASSLKKSKRNMKGSYGPLLHLNMILIKPFFSSASEIFKSSGYIWT